MSRDPPDRPVLYTVSATLASENDADDYVRWLMAGHLEAVQRGGARSAVVSRLVEPKVPIVLEVTYTFAGRDAFEKYQTDHAPRLRAEGLAVFGSRGVHFQRRLGVILSGESGLDSCPPASP